MAEVTVNVHGNRVARARALELAVTFAATRQPVSAAEVVRYAEVFYTFLTKEDGDW